MTLFMEEWHWEKGDGGERRGGSVADMVRWRMMGWIFIIREVWVKSGWKQAHGVQTGYVAHDGDSGITR